MNELMAEYFTVKDKAPEEVKNAYKRYIDILEEEFKGREKSPFV